MDKQYNHKLYEQEIYKKWEASGAFTRGEKEGKKPFTILMPPPNANASLHAGHAMYTVEDILIRWKRMQGFAAIWFPGMDHAGLETQSVYEKHLAKQGKSRMDFDRETLYRDVYKFVQDNSGVIYNQFRSLGFSADWKRSTFTLDEKVLKRVFETFKKLHDEGLIYRDDYLVNYCTHCGTTLADLEVNHVEREDPLYFIRYKLADGKEDVLVATVRPEPIYVDRYLAVNPQDKKNKHLIDKEALNPLTGARMKIIGDESVDPKFGTGIMKLTPAHDPADFELAKKLGLPVEQAIDWSGRMVNKGGRYDRMKVREARRQVIEDLGTAVEKIDEHYLHSVPVCYRCGHDLESLILPNWFVSVNKLKKPAIAAVKEGRIKFTPSRFGKEYYQWMENMRDWPISRQIVWGIRIPIWYKIDDKASNIWVWWLDKERELKQGNVRQFLDEGIKLEEIETGLQKVSAQPKPSGPDYVISIDKPGNEYLPETDTFDTWFSSGQWPLVTLNYPDGDDFKKYYPTDVMGTLSEIIKFWVSRMIMFGLYLTNEVPFKTVYLWSMVVDAKGQKMSKSKGNVVNPSELIEKYGADALRMSLVYGIAPGSRVPLAEEKVRAMRNFANKVWNIARFAAEGEKEQVDEKQTINDDDQWILEELRKTTEIVNEGLSTFRFNQSAEEIYEFIWHKLADVYLEKIKTRKNESLPTLIQVLKTSLKLLHPFMPFVTEAAYAEIGEGLLINEDWPN